MMSKRERIKLKKIDDVLISSETIEAQRFLFEGGDDCVVVKPTKVQEDRVNANYLPAALSDTLRSWLIDLPERSIYT
jgi:hypothetical protein